MQAVALGIRFLLELGMIIALSNWGFRAGGEVVPLALGIGLPVLAMLVWGTFVSPRARLRLSDLPRQGLALAMFALGAVALAASGLVPLALLFASVALVDTWLIYRWRL